MRTCENPAIIAFTSMPPLWQAGYSLLLTTFFISPWLELKWQHHFVITSAHIYVNRIHWLRNHALFLVVKTRFSYADPTPPVFKTQQWPSQIKRPRWPGPSKYPCPLIAWLQDWAAPVPMVGHHESNPGFQLVKLQCYHWAKSTHYIYEICMNPQQKSEIVHTRESSRVKEVTSLHFTDIDRLGKLIMAGGEKDWV